MHEKYGFDRETAVTARPGEPSVYDAELHEGWRIGMGVNGGLLLALAGRALAEELGGDGQGHRDPFSISAYYLSTSLPGPVTARTETLRRGRTVSTGMVSLVQNGEERLRAIATYGDLNGHDHAGDVRTSATPPQMPPPEKCVGTDAAPPEFLKNSPMLERIELRLDPDTVGWAVGAPSGRGMVQGWLRMPDGREPDPLMLLLAVDSLPPVSFDLGIPGWAPTLELTTHVRARPEPGWLRLKHSTRNFADGYMEEDAEVWDSAGRLVAQSRQLARVRLPEGAA
ncbi:thioesterase family protein [Actinacidiphila glaucinigra]|uniref:thioesterase family protein n=1 Tax=Actinacidiphila glaucinigra TaxID=235986 RepID=UPI002DDBE2D5|nr:thioesterase family protein [Actinacidiphila glaucinigra]WSD59265.1 thioesterase family protein [Actinacidiphila glaucinigra]